MIPEVYKVFINRIIVKTDNQEVKWEKATDKNFILKTNDATIEIGFYRDDDAETSFYYFRFYSISSKKTTGFRVSHVENDYQMMEQLYYVASASANNIQDELDKFLDAL
jgi:hypothetical protein